MAVSVCGYHPLCVEWRSVALLGPCWMEAGALLTTGEGLVRAAAVMHHQMAAAPLPPPRGGSSGAAAVYRAGLCTVWLLILHAVRVVQLGRSAERSSDALDTGVCAVAGTTLV